MATHETRRAINFCETTVSPVRRELSENTILQKSCISEGDLVYCGVIEDFGNIFPCEALPKQHS